MFSRYSSEFSCSTHRLFDALEHEMRLGLPTEVNAALSRRAAFLPPADVYRNSKSKRQILPRTQKRSKKQNKAL
jgi:hypothetical protein